MNLQVYIYKSLYNRRTKITGLYQLVTRYCNLAEYLIGWDGHCVVPIRTVQNIQVI